MKAIAASALAFLALAAVALGKTLTAEGIGVSLDVPEGWNDSPEMTAAIRPPAELIAGLVAADGKRTFTALSAKLKANEAAGYSQGLLDSLHRQGFTLSASTPIVNQLTFDSYTGTRTGESAPVLQIFSTFANGRAFSISMSSQVGDPTQDAELQAMVRSFHFLTPPQPFPQVAAGGRVKPETVQKITRLSLIVGLLVCPAVLVVGFLVLLRKK